jgi:hypothetical protein
MSGNINSKIAQLLHQPPNFRTAGADLGSDFRSAHNHGGVGDEQTHNAPQPRVGLWRDPLWRQRSYPRTSVWS